ncbi:GNAT family N-acetyltransferase [Aureibacter tunicatorum]|uniref:Acetyltransferase n=1 Tax=Aureibacter tunicatorum TaxID=866807 RepID=A0AAE3XP73_9BACT|nr:GNAT family N-acetyltransferase [Aureibacter tunicatorum]MDR6240572.1 putative acetyltransferase [Aureibacter tunicatorum]BDD06567.1 N-acetyltransferase [Aureibacter tunicatorum]
MKIELGKLDHPLVIELLEEHIKDMRSISPPESKHALDLVGLSADDISFWTIWNEHGEVMGCGALKALDDKHAEIKSMRTSLKFRSQGVAAFMLEHLISEAKMKGFECIQLETGAMDFFKPAHRLYAKYGFEQCGPFANYREDPLSLFMLLNLN